MKGIRMEPTVDNDVVKPFTILQMTNGKKASSVMLRIKKGPSMHTLSRASFSDNNESFLSGAEFEIVLPCMYLNQKTSVDFIINLILTEHRYLNEDMFALGGYLKDNNLKGCDFSKQAPFQITRFYIKGRKCREGFLQIDHKQYVELLSCVWKLQKE